MLTTILLTHLFRAAVVLVPAASILVLLVFGPEDAFGVVVGGVLVVLDGAGLIYLVGKLLDPRQTAPTKLSLLALLLLKLAAVFGLLWLALAVYSLSTLGVVIGIGVGLAAILAGTTRGSSSPEGRAAIEAAEREIAEEMRDKPRDSG